MKVYQGQGCFRQVDYRENHGQVYWWKTGCPSSQNTDMVFIDDSSEEIYVQMRWEYVPALIAALQLAMEHKEMEDPTHPEGINENELVDRDRGQP